MSSDDEEPDYPRAWLAWYLADLVPERWRIIPGFILPETIDRPTVTITHTEINPQPAAPASDSLVNDVVIRIAENLADPAKAEVALDDEVLELVYVLKGSERLKWLSAKKVDIADTEYLGWDITVQVLSTNTHSVIPPAEPEEEE